jgi:hypothetical protein
VNNPAYVRLRVSATIEWRRDVEPAAAGRRLDALLRDLLSPWRDGALRPEDWPVSAFEHVIRAQPDVAGLVSLAVAAVPDAGMVGDPALTVAVSAPSHAIDSVTTVATAGVEGY